MPAASYDARAFEQNSSNPGSFDALSFAIESRSCAWELHHLLRSIDPAAWKGEIVDAARRRVAELTERLGRLLDGWPEAPTLATLAIRVREVAAVIQANLPAEDLAAAELRAAWDRFRIATLPAYEALAAALRAASLPVPSLRPSNLRRSALHAASGLVVALLVLYVFPASWLGFIAGFFTVCAWTMEIARKRSRTVNRILMGILGRFAHPHEATRVNSSTWFCTGLFAITFFATPLAAALAIAILGFADPAAAMIGRRWGKTRLASGRSVEGTAGFVAVGTLVAATLIGVYAPMFTAMETVLVAGIAALTGGIVELYSRRLDDNFSIPVTAAMGAMVGFWLVG